MPIKDINDRELTGIPIPRGKDVIINITGSNHDLRVWGSDSYEWKPERWLEPLPEAVLKAKFIRICEWCVARTEKSTNELVNQNDIHWWLTILYVSCRLCFLFFLAVFYINSILIFKFSQLEMSMFIIFSKNVFIMIHI